MLQSTAMHLENQQNIYSAMQQSWHTFEIIHEIVPDSWLSTYLLTAVNSQQTQACETTHERTHGWVNSSVNSWQSTRLPSHGYQFMAVSLSTLLL